MAVDDSPRSKRGLDILLRFTNPRDTLTLVHFTRSMTYNHALADANNAFKKYYDDELREMGPVDSKFIFVEVEHGADIADSIVDYANESSADMFAIAPRATKDRSSITEKIVGNVMISVLLCKN